MEGAPNGTAGPSLQEASLRAWPGRERREPDATSPSYTVRAPLARWLRTEAVRAGRDLGHVRVLDVGCGRKPYYPIFAPFASEYLGLDLVNPMAEVSAAAEAIPLPNDSFDLILCLQFLEHAADPPAVVRELSRLLRPGGRVLAATHGVSVYHPDPVDHWRWTHTGLEMLFAANGSWRSVSVQAGAGSSSCLAMLVSFYLGVLHRRLQLKGTARQSTRLINLAAHRLDNLAGTADCRRPGSLVANYHVTADAL